MHKWNRVKSISLEKEGEISSILRKRLMDSVDSYKIVHIRLRPHYTNYKYNELLKKRVQKEISRRLSNLEDKIFMSISFFKIIYRARWKIKI